MKRALAVVGTLLMTSVAAQAAQVPTNMCDEGAFVVGDKTYSFDDIAVESTDATKFNEQGPITAYGYLVLVEMGRELNDNIVAKMGTISSCTSTGMAAVESGNLVDVVFARSDYADEAWKDVRRSILKAEGGLMPKGLIALTGKFEIFTDTYGLYFRADGAKVVATFK